MTAGRTNVVARKSFLFFKTTLILPLLVLWCFEGIVLGMESSGTGALVCQLMCNLITIGQLTLAQC